ncbi:uncharacterized protein LOC143603051 [Bidens hawaiensis]|uniref:uncharacterized protein LOC143603051 n=1 Tax=Bidens hawaiensis TaxID=980011 RepID=UPI00404B9A91
MPDDVPALLELHVEKGEFVDRLWRGQKRLPEDNLTKGKELTVIAKGGNNIDDVCDPMEHGGCCNNPPIAPEDPTNYKCATKSTSQKNKVMIKNQVSSNMSNKSGPATHKVYNMPTWLETWEREDVYATLALIGAALSVAVAYNCYRQLG